MNLIDNTAALSNRKPPEVLGVLKTWWIKEKASFPQAEVFALRGEGF
jgi:hypothetical protein